MNGDQAGPCGQLDGFGGEMVCIKREDYLEWPEYFMAVAFLSAQRSKDPNSQVGACIVNSENKIVGIGYNGMPNGCSDDLLPWTRTAQSKLDTKYPYAVLAAAGGNGDLAMAAHLLEERAGRRNVEVLDPLGDVSVRLGLLIFSDSEGSMKDLFYHQPLLLNGIIMWKFKDSVSHSTHQLEDRSVCSKKTCIMAEQLCCHLICSHREHIRIIQFINSHTDQLTTLLLKANFTL